jgi:hypothetical protein
VTLPSGYPEPASYPVTKEYVAEIDAVKTKPKAHPLWAFFHLPTGAEAKLKAGAGMPDNGSLQRLDDEVVDNASGECCRGRDTGEGGRGGREEGRKGGREEVLCGVPRSVYAMS